MCVSQGGSKRYRRYFREETVPIKSISVSVKYRRYRWYRLRFSLHRKTREMPMHQKTLIFCSWGGNVCFYDGTDGTDGTGDFPLSILRYRQGQKGTVFRLLTSVIKATDSDSLKLNDGTAFPLSKNRICTCHNFLKTGGFWRGIKC